MKYLKSTSRSTRHPTGYCRNLCQSYGATKTRNESIYTDNCRCYNCEMYIPREKLLDMNVKGSKAKCPCCMKCWMKGVHVGIGLQKLRERSKAQRLTRAKNRLALEIQKQKNRLAVMEGVTAP